jgi:hypothetical protein
MSKASAPVPVTIITVIIMATAIPTGTTILTITRTTALPAECGRP